jgi:fatty acid desaturase
VFAFVVTAGWYLHVVRADAPSQRQAAVLRAAVLAAAVVPVALAFRASLWSLAGASPEASGLPALCLLLVAAALIGFTASLAAEHLARGRRERRAR